MILHHRAEESTIIQLKPNKVVFIWYIFAKCRKLPIIDKQEDGLSGQMYMERGPCKSERA